MMQFLVWNSSMFKQDKDNIFLNGIKIPMNIFKMLEPSYTFPIGLIVMFYDGMKRNYRTKHNSWNVMGEWAEGDRYLNRIGEFSQLMKMMEQENYEAQQAVEEVKKSLNEPDANPKYPTEDSLNVKLHHGADINKSRTKRVRTTSKRSSSSGDQHSG